MKYNHTVVQDGQTYQPGEEVPDMGSIVAFETSGNLRKYIGLSKDVDKLPKYSNDYKAKLGTGPYSGRMKFGTVKQDSLDLKFIKGKNGLPVSLKASNFDAQAPLRDVGGFSDIQNEMPFYRESYMVTEKEEQEYANYQSAENSNMANQVLQEIAKKPFSLIQGALVVPERQIWELLAPEDGVPKVTVNIEGKKYVVEYTTDSGAAHKKDHFVEISGDEDKWNASATATPLRMDSCTFRQI